MESPSNLNINRAVKLTGEACKQIDELLELRTNRPADEFAWRCEFADKCSLLSRHIRPELLKTYRQLDHKCPPALVEAIGNVLDVVNQVNGRSNVEDWDELGMLPGHGAELMKAVEVAQTITTNPTDGTEFPPLTDNEVAVLLFLDSNFPVLQTLDNISVVSRDTATKIIKSLIKAGLACRPKGDRDGATVTDKGLMLAQILKSKNSH